VSRLGLLAAAAAVALVVVVAAIVISQGGAEDEEAAPRNEEAASLPPLQQDGVSLGAPNAPATLIEFADLQCPFCADYAVEQLPAVIDDHVRSGRLRLELRLLAFLGPDSVRGRQVAHAAALQDRMWNYTERFFRNQGPENSGYATNQFLERLARQTPGLDVEQLSQDFADEEAAALTRQAERMGRQLGVEGTPSFYLVQDGERPVPIEIEELDEALAGE
jgi:protein-disulfide isomerase